MKELGYQVFIVPEAATLIFNGGGMLDMKEYNKAQAISF
jgi:thymidylate kinase